MRHDVRKLNSNAAYPSQAEIYAALVTVIDLPPVELVTRFELTFDTYGVTTISLEMLAGTVRETTQA